MPLVWIISDARNDTALESALARLPRGGGLIFRHYHLPPAQRRARFRQLLRTAHRHGHCAVWSGTMQEARRMAADGAYGSAAQLASGAKGLRLTTVHSLREVGLASGRRADALVLSPVFGTRSHPDATALSTMRFRLIAARALRPVIALGGMNAARGRRIGCHRWAGIDAFCDEANRRNTGDS